MQEIHAINTPIYIGIFLSTILGIIGIIYWLAKDINLIRWITAFHIITTISSFLLTETVNLIFKGIFYTYFDINSLPEQIMLTIILLAFVSQIMFVANLIVSLIRTLFKKHQKNKPQQTI